MPLKIVYGNIDFPYGHAYGEDTTNPNITTAEVAAKLEKRYHIYKTFHKAHKEEIVGPIAAKLSAMMLNITMGVPVNIKHEMKYSAEHVAPLFHKFLDNQEMDGLAGIPTKRALAGIIHRRKKRMVLKKDGQAQPRPSFEDSKLYRDKTKVWLELT